MDGGQYCPPFWDYRDYASNPGPAWAGGRYGERVSFLAIENAVQMRGVTKTFGRVIANNKVDMEIHTGEILSFTCTPVE